MMIEMAGVKKNYTTGGVITPALRGVSLLVETGDFIAIMGTSGSGKSTLLNIIGGMDVATEGRYVYDGCEVTSLKTMELHAFRKKNVSFVFQNFALIKQYSVADNVAIPLFAKGVGRRKRTQIVEESLRKVGILDQKDKLPGYLSGGQQQRCAIARALASGNPLILADEPTGALDAKTSSEILELFQELNEEGKTIIIVTHDSAVAKCAKRVIRLEDGCIVSDFRNRAEH